MRRLRSPVVAMRLIAGLVLAAGLLSAAPVRALEAGDDTVSGNYDTGAFSSIQIVNYIVGAQRFYNSGYFGQNTLIANVEAGHIWSGHEVFDRSGFGLPNSPALSYNATSDPLTSPELGSVDYHATMVGNVLAGTGDLGNGNLSLLGAGMAPLATLWSGAIATTWDHTPANIGSFEISDASFLAPYKAFFGGTLGRKPDVINSSWGFDDPAAQAGENRILDALAAANSSVAFVRSAGNGGPTAAPGAGLNGITVGSLGGGADAHPFLRKSDFTSGAAADFYNPGTGITVTGVRAAVAIAAPGEDFALAAYLPRTSARILEALGQPVSLDWGEVADSNPADFTILTVPKRFAKIGDPHAEIDAAAGSLEGLLELADRRLAAAARLAGALVDVELLAKIARCAVRVHVVAERRPALADRVAQHVANRLDDPLPLGAADAPRGPAWPHAGTEQRLACIDVADAYDRVLIHEEQLDRDLATACARREIFGVELPVERLGPEIREQRVFRGVAGAPVQAAEASRIVEAQALTGVEHQIVVVVQDPRGRRRHHAQAA